MKYSVIVILLTLGLASCAAPQGKHVVAPSHAAVTASVERVSTHITAASSHAAKAKASIERAIKSNPSSLDLKDANTETDALTNELLGARKELVVLRKANSDYESKVKDQNIKLNKLSDKNAKMQKVYDQVNKYWGIGGILYGFGQLFKHLLILTAVIIVVALLLFAASVALKGFFPWLAPVGAFFNMIGRGIASLFKPKNKG